MGIERRITAKVHSGRAFYHRSGFTGAAILSRKDIHLAGYAAPKKISDDYGMEPGIEHGGCLARSMWKLFRKR